MKVHPILLAIPWTLIFAELDYAARKRRKRRAKRLVVERELRVRGSLPE